MTAAPEGVPSRRWPTLNRGRLRSLMILVIAVVGTLASLGVCLLALSWEYRAVLSDFENRAKSHLLTIDGEMQAASTLLSTVRAYFEASERPVSRAEFERFSKDLHDRVVGLRDIGWAPRVTVAEREGFERTVRASGWPDFQILERSDTAHSGGLVRAGEREVYYPILYLDSGAVTQPVLGFDLASEPLRKAAVERAQTTRQAAATPPLKLITVKRPRGGVMGFVPVGGAAGSAAAPGVVLGVVDIDVMMEHILAERTRLNDIDVYVYEPGGTPGERLIYWRSSRGKGTPEPSEQAVLAGTHWQGTVSLLDQRWSIVFVPSAPLDRAALNWHAVMPLLIGLAVTLLIVAYLLVSARRTLHLERLTAELRRTTDDLNRNAERMNHLARHDTLTGLPNRALFRERMDDAVARLRRGRPFALLCLDLDHFKPVNDSLGHGAGDRLLLQVAERLKAAVREVDTVARLGGDEFAIVMADTASAELVQVVAARLVESLARPFDLFGKEARIGLSVGIALAPADGESADLLLNRADMALYAAKAAGRGRYCFFDASMGADKVKPATA